MHEYSEGICSNILSMENDLKREFEILLTESSKLAFRVAYSVLRHTENAEDVAQEAFTKAYASFRDLRDRERFRAWLVRMTWRLAIDRIRSDRRRSVRESAPIETQAIPTPAQTILEKERAARLWNAIDSLPEKLRITIVLSGIEEHDTGEVARLLGLPEGTVKSRMFLARQRLKELLT